LEIISLKLEILPNAKIYKNLANAKVSALQRCWLKTVLWHEDSRSRSF